MQRTLRTLAIALLLCAPAIAHDGYRSSYGGQGYRPYGHKHYGYRRYSYRAYPRASYVQRYRYENRFYTGRSYLNFRPHGQRYGARSCGYGHGYGYGYASPGYPYRTYAGPYVALAPIYSRYGASLTLVDPVIEREPAGSRASDGDGLPQPRTERVGSRFLKTAR